MASSNPSCNLLLLLLLALLWAAKSETKQVHLHFFLHDIIQGPRPTAVKVAPATSPSDNLNFGDIYVLDDPLTESPALSSKLVGRAQGTYVVASQDPNDVALLVTANLVFKGGAYDGSTLAVVSRFSLSAEKTELTVVGGSGAFRMARGYALSTVYSSDNATVLEWDVYVKK